ncbi:MAG: TetR/AcrR family transcriptional regulator [Anaerolineae bacterium]|nr:TetR/AcrR family transcriptional regulator [Anaerolineae bacterium]
MAKSNNDLIQEQLIAARRNQILDAATTIFAEKGFHRATIRDVAKAAGIADGTIYIYFENKTAVLMGILDRLNETDQREANFEQSADMDIDTFFRMHLRQRLDFIGPKGMQVIQIVLSEILVNLDLRDLYYEKIIGPTFQLAERYFHGWMDAGLIRKFDVPIMMRMITSLVLGLLVLRLLGDPTIEEQWQKLPDVIADMVLYGIQGEKS